MERGVSVEQVRTAVRLAKAHGIAVGMFLMWGYEGEEIEDIAATVEHVKATDPDVFFTNLRANAVYFLVGRHAGLVPYFFPAVFAMAALVLVPSFPAALATLILAGMAWMAVTSVGATSIELHPGSEPMRAICSNAMRSGTPASATK